MIEEFVSAWLVTTETDKRHRPSKHVPASALDHVDKMFIKHKLHDVESELFHEDKLSSLDGDTRHMVIAFIILQRHSSLSNLISGEARAMSFGLIGGWGPLYISKCPLHITSVFILPS